MKKKSMYEEQSSVCPDYSGSGRDSFLVEYIQQLAANARPGLRIAELSVGRGGLSKALVEALPSADFTFADISVANLEMLSASLKSVKSRLKQPPTLLECDFDTQFHLLGDGVFDVVIAVDILEHVFDVFGFIANCRRVLRPGGALILRVPNIAYVRHRIAILFGRLPVTSSWFGKSGDLSEWKRLWGWDGCHLHNFTIPIIKRMLSDEGFQIERCSDPGARFAGIRNFCKGLLFSNPTFVAYRK